MILALQIVVLIGLAGLLAAWARAWPYPSPVVRALLPAQQRWPEAQIREMLAAGRFHPRYLGFFNRDPLRTPPPGSDLLAPADGLLLSVEVRDDVRYIVIALSFWDVHVQRCPLAGRLISIDTLGDVYRDGEGRDFIFLAAKHSPVQKRLVLATEHGPVAVRLITSVAARRIEVWPTLETQLARGERIGRILLGSTVVLEVPADWGCLATPGQRLRAGETPLVAAP